MLKLNRGDQAKQCFMEALALDVKCYESFEQLMSGEMMTPEEGKLGILTRMLSHFFSGRLQNGNLSKAWRTPLRPLKMLSSFN